MSDLATIQRQFQDYLLAQDTEAAQDILQPLIVSTTAIPASIRTRIYKDAYQLRLLDALANNFPCLKRYVGDDTFERLGGDYAQKHPSSYRSIRWFGDQFAAFLAQNLADEYGIVAELAAFEWAMTLAFDAADAPIIGINDVAKVPPTSWETLRFITHPSLQHLVLSWNSTAIWEALNQEQAPASPIKTTSAQHWLLWRQEYGNRFYAMEADEAFAIDAVRQGQTFGDICLGLCQWHEEAEVGVRAASLLKKWVHSQIIAGISLEE